MTAKGNPVVSVVIPSFNRSELIHERALKSAIAQTYEPKQIIVVDDGSTEPYDINLPAWYYKPWEKNRGGSAARNFGVSKAQGTYVVFVDDDNELHPTFLEETVPVLEDLKEVQALVATRIVQYDDRQEIAQPPTKTKFLAIDWGWLIRREVFEKIQYDTSIWGDEDADFGIQFHNAGFKAALYDKPLATAYALREQDATANTYPTERRLRGLRNFLDKNLHEYTDPNERRYILRLAGRNFLRAGRYGTAIRYFYSSYRALPNARTLLHLLSALLGWRAYDKYMSYEESYV